jgi:hypothetical protein
MAAAPLPDPTTAQPPSGAVCLPGWLLVGNLIGLGGVIILLVVEMSQTGRWRPLLVPCLFLALLMLQFFSFWLTGRWREGAETVPHGPQPGAEPATPADGGRDSGSP